MAFYRESNPHKRIERLFEEFLMVKKPKVAFFARPSDVWQPPTDVYETENEVVIKMAISGTDPKNISVEYQDGSITISGKREDNLEHKKLCFHQMEIHYGYFERRVYIPRDIHIDEDSIEARYSDGFLVITVPKAKQGQPKADSVKIELK